jgi:hypothetical protein
VASLEKIPAGATAEKSDGLKLNRRFDCLSQRAVFAHRFFDQCFELFARH